MSEKQVLINKSNDYEQTIHAIVGFMNLYRFDDTSHTMRNDVLVFQGRKLIKINDPSSYCTPDLGILIPTNQGILCEVKKSFPNNQNYWFDDFEQLMSYNDSFSNWPSVDGIVSDHDIVLITHQTRGGAVKRYYLERKDTEIFFTRPFAIVQFNESTESEHYYFFQKIYGVLSISNVNERLELGVQVPMNRLLAEYSMIKLYDSKPPLPYLLYVIWENTVIDNVRSDPKFLKLRSNQKIEVNLRVDLIVDTLFKGFTFQVLSPDLQPKIPMREWIVDACNYLVNFNMAEWIDNEKNEIKIFFKKYGSILTYFIGRCSELPSEEPSLFDGQAISNN